MGKELDNLKIREFPNFRLLISDFFPIAIGIQTSNF